MLMMYVKQALWITLLISAPLVLYTMAVGLLLGFIQAIFQLQDQALPFAAKLFGSLAIMIVLGPWMADLLVQFTDSLFAMMGQVGQR